MNCQKNYPLHLRIFSAVFLLSLLSPSAAYSSSKVANATIKSEPDYTEIRNAIMKNDLRRVKSLLKGNDSWLSRNRTWNVAQIAAEIGKVDIVRYVTEKEPSVLELENEENETIAHIAAKRGRLDVIRYIAEKKPSFFEEDGDSIAGVANKYNRMAIIFFIAQKKDSVYAKRYGSGKGTSILHLAAIRNFLDARALKFFVEKKHFDLSTVVTDENETIAHLAVRHDNLDLVRYILCEKPTISRLKDSNQKMLINLARERHNLSVMKCVLESMGPPLDHYELELYCNTARTAVSKGDVNLVRSIVRICPRVLEEKHIGGTLAHVAATHGHCDVLELLATKRPSMLTQRGSYGWNTPLHLVVLKNLEIAMPFMRFLVKETGETALMRNVQGKTVPEIAAENGNFGVIRCVIEELSSFNDSCNIAEISIEHGHPYIFWYIALKQPAKLADETLLTIAFVERLLRMETLQKEGLALVDNNCCASIIARIAAANGHLAMIQFIAERNPSAFTERDTDGNTALHHAVAGNAMDLETLKSLVEVNEPSLMDTDSNAKTLVNFAARGGNLDTVRYIVNKFPSVLINDEGECDDKIAREAIIHDHPEVIEFLEDRWCKCLPRWDHEKFVNRTVYEATKRGALKLLRYLINENKVDVTAFSENGEPLIFAAVRSPNFAILKYLVEEENADLTQLNGNGDNILYTAVDKNDLHAITYILDERKAQIDINWQNKVGDTLVHAALHKVIASRNSIIPESEKYWRSDEKDTDALLKYLVLEKRADLNLPGHEGKTPLLCAASQGHREISKFLMDHGADPKMNAKNDRDFWQLQVSVTPSAERTTGNMKAP